VGSKRLNAFGIAVVAVLLAGVWMGAARVAAFAGPDPAFGSGGIVLTPFGTPLGAGDARIDALAVQPDGKIVAAGFGRDGRNNKFALARYNPDGSLDGSFGSGGTVLTQVSAAEGSHDEITALVVQPDGKLVVAGYASFGQQLIALARYNGADGSLDQTFNPNGNVITGMPGTLLSPVGNAGVARAMGLVEQPDGKLVVAGYARDATVAKFALVRYQADSSLDTTFGTGGRTLTPIGSGSFAAISALSRLADGRFVVAGTVADGGRDKFALARYTANGALDTTFGTGGSVLTPVGSGDATLRAMYVDPAGRLVVAGTAKDGSSNVFAVARYSANGALDTTGFGTGGIALTPVGSDGGAGAFAVTTDGSGLLVGGVASDGGVAKFALVRYGDDGSVDTGFTPNGAALTAIGDGSFASISSLILSGGAPVAGGYARNGGANLFALTRYADLPEATPVTPPAQAAAGPAVCFDRLQTKVCPGSARVAAVTAGRCKVKTRWVRMSHKGRAKVKLSCPSAVRGSLKLHRVRGKHRGSVLGSSSLSLKKGGSKTVSVKLSKKARRLLRKERRLRADAVFTAKTKAAKGRNTSRKLTLEAPK
jgi:uncharacterized delta-60 repeat protein